MVRWTEGVRWMTTEGGVTDLVELGAGKVLSGLAKRISPDTGAVSIGTPADVDAFIAGLGA
jgi:[acyl-carrier-protein] S-malonyltransferase